MTTAPDPNADTLVKVGESLARDVRRRIASGELQPGDRLPPEDVLMSTLGLSRMTVREGLRILESQGLIQVRRGRQGGARITHPTVADLAPSLALVLQLKQVSYRDLHEASRLIEPALAAELARRHTDDDVRALAEIADRAAAAARVKDGTGLARAATEMHEAVMTRAGNTTLSVFSGLVRELMADYYQAAVATPEAPALYDRAARSYRKFARLVAAGDADGARDHWAKQLAFTSAGMADYDDVIAFL